jgi:hypothetical protein
VGEEAALNHPEVTARALAILRSGSPFEWHVITLLALVVYVYLNEISKKNWNGVAAALALYMVHWLVEIVNALIQHFSGHALWTVPTGTAFLLLIGVGVEISLMFSIAGLVLTKVLPADRRARVLGVNNRLAFVLVNAAFFSIVELFLVRTPTFAWVYPWWGAVPVFLTVYVPFFLAAAYAFDAPPRARRALIGGLAGLNAAALVVFIGILGWI